MNVPDTLTFSHDDIYNAVSSHAPTVQRNLVDLFAKSNPAFFDPAYSHYTGSLRFRNYSPQQGAVTPSIFDYRIEIGGSIAISYTPVGIPNTRLAGDYILVKVSAQANRTWTTPTGWINLGGASMAEFSYRTFLKISNGSENAYMTISMSGFARTTSTTLLIRGATSYSFEGVSTITSKALSYGISGTALLGGSLAVRTVAISEKGVNATITGTGWLSELNSQLDAGFGWMVGSYDASIAVTPPICSFAWNFSAYFGHTGVIFKS